MALCAGDCFFAAIEAGYAAVKQRLQPDMTELEAYLTVEAGIETPPPRS